jgi:hypothetical protein
MVTIESSFNKGTGRVRRVPAEICHCVSQVEIAGELVPLLSVKLAAGERQLHFNLSAIETRKLARLLAPYALILLALLALSGCTVHVHEQPAAGGYQYRASGSAYRRVYVAPRRAACSEVRHVRARPSRQRPRRRSRWGHR